MTDKSSDSKSGKTRHWVSLVPSGLNRQHPNHFLEMLGVAWENRDNLAYAWRILRDGCALGTDARPTGGIDDHLGGRFARYTVSGTARSLHLEISYARPHAARWPAQTIACDMRLSGQRRTQ